MTSFDSSFGILDTCQLSILYRRKEKRKIKFSETNATEGKLPKSLTKMVIQVATSKQAISFAVAYCRLTKGNSISVIAFTDQLDLNMVTILRLCFNMQYT